MRQSEDEKQRNSWEQKKPVRSYETKEAVGLKDKIRMYAELWMYPRVSIKESLDQRKYQSSHKVIKIITMEL